MPAEFYQKWTIIENKEMRKETPIKQEEKKVVEEEEQENPVDQLDEVKMPIPDEESEKYEDSFEAEIEMGDQSAPPMSEIPIKTKVRDLFDSSSDDSDNFIEISSEEDKDPFAFQIENYATKALPSESESYYKC